MALLVRVAAPLPADCPLSQRQLDILRLVADGLTTYGIARELSLAGATVDNHVGVINRVLGTGSRLRAVLTAVHAGWLVLESATGPDPA